jgi:hypothetical protein
VCSIVTHLWQCMKYDWIKTPKFKKINKTCFSCSPMCSPCVSMCEVWVNYDSTTRLWWHFYIRASSSNGYHPLSRVAALTLLTIPHCTKDLTVWRQQKKRENSITKMNYKDELAKELGVWRKGVMPKQGVWKRCGKREEEGYEYVCLFTTFIINALHALPFLLYPY